MMVIGNKIDIQTDRAVSKEEGKALAEDFGAGFLEVSVSTIVSIFLDQDDHVNIYCHDRRRRTSR